MQEYHLEKLHHALGGQKTLEQHNINTALCKTTTFENLRTALQAHVFFLIDKKPWEKKCGKMIAAEEGVKKDTVGGVVHI